MVLSLPISYVDQRSLPCASRELAACVDGSGGFWVSWISHYSGVDRVMSRRWCELEAGPVEQVSETPGEYINPAVVATAEGPLFLWRAYTEGRWAVQSRLRADGEWKDEVALDPGLGHVTAYTAAADAEGCAWLVFVARKKATWSLWCTERQDDEWSMPVLVAHERARMERPSLAIASDGTKWLVWDSYSGGTYRIRAAQGRDGRWREPETVSEGEEWQLLPTVACSSCGQPFAAWILSRLIKDEHGVHDHWPWLVCAKREGNEWQLIGAEDLADGPAGAVESLAQGLLSSETYVGYMGRRRHPMLVADEDGGIWAVWERKVREDSETVRWGALCARRYDGEEWRSPVQLSDRGVCYQLDEAATVQSGKLWVACKGNPAQYSPAEHGDILGFTVDMGEAAVHLSWPLRKWKRWRPLEAPTVSLPERFVIERDGEPFYLFWGDLHCHSFQSPDAEGEVDELLAYARDVSALDFCALADNDWYPNNILTAGMWRYIEDTAQEFSVPGEFLAFSGYEWTYREDWLGRWNHRIVYYPGPGREVFRRTEPSGGDVEAFIRSMCQTDGLANAHHHQWSVICEAFDRNVEVCSGWQWHTEDLREVLVKLAAGHRIGFVGSSDGHRYVPGDGGGLAAVYARALTPEAIFEALHSRRNYATNGNRAVIDFRVSGLLMGEEGTTTEPPRAVAQVIGGSGVRAVEIWRDGVVAYSVCGGGRPEVSFDWEDVDVGEGIHYYHLRVVLEGETPKLPHNSAPARGNMAWTSPIWVMVRRPT